MVTVFWAGAGIGCGDEPDGGAPTGAGTSTAVGGTGGGGASTGATGGGGAGGAAGGAPVVPTVLLPRTSILPEELAILVNSADAQSLAAASYYRQQRQIPEANVITLDVPAGNMITQAQFAALAAQVDGAVGPDIQAFVITWTAPYRVECMSITSAFALGYDDMYCNTGSGGCSQTAPVDYFDSDSLRPFTDHGIRPAMMLGAEQLQDAQDLVDRGIASDGTYPSGDGYFVRSHDTARSVRYGNFIQTVADWDYPEGLALTYLDNSSGTGQSYIDNTQDVLFYFASTATVDAIDTNTFRPGAVADHLTSFGGRLYENGQMKVLRWLEAGVTASFGTVVEPCNYTTKFPNTQVMLPHYFRGETVLEAYWKSVHWPGEGLFVGEPLARPWGGAQIDYQDQLLTIRTTLLDPTKEYEVGESDSEQGPFTVVRDSITIAQHQLATIEIPDALAAYYRLAESVP